MSVVFVDDPEIVESIEINEWKGSRTLVLNGRPFSFYMHEDGPQYEAEDGELGVLRLPLLVEFGVKVKRTRRRPKGLDK